VTAHAALVERSERVIIYGAGEGASRSVAGTLLVSRIKPNFRQRAAPPGGPNAT